MRAAIDRLVERWFALPGWGKVASVGAAVASVFSVGMAWGDRRPVGAFFESFVAIVLYLVLLFGTFAGAMWFGIKVAEKTRRPWVGWIAGIAFWLGIGVVFTLAVSEIPGVGWRFNRMLQSDD